MALTWEHPHLWLDPDSTHLNIHAGGQVQGHELVHCLGGQVLDVDQPLVQAHLQEMRGRMQHRGEVKKGGASHAEREAARDRGGHPS